MKLLGWWRRRSKGFTITEILVSLVIAGVITASLGSILIDMIQTESREAALNQLRQDLKATLDVISTDLSQAVFVYNGNCLAGSGSCGDTSRSEPLTNYLPDFPNTMRPGVGNVDFGALSLLPKPTGVCPIRHAAGLLKGMVNRSGKCGSTLPRAEKWPPQLYLGGVLH